MRHQAGQFAALRNSDSEPAPGISKPWPGYLEADSVAHVWPEPLAGSFIWSLTYTDIFKRLDP